MTQLLSVYCGAGTSSPKCPKRLFHFDRTTRIVTWDTSTFERALVVMRAETTPEYQLEALSEGAEVTGFKETAASRFESSGLLRHFRHLEGPWAMPHDHTFYVVCTCSTLYWLVDTEKIRAASRPRVNRSLVDAEIDEITPDGYWGPSRPEIRELLPGARLQAHEQRQRDPAPE